MEAKEIKRKIASIKNIWQLTGALETLSALKMKKAQKIDLLSRPFAQKTAEILSLLEINLKRNQSVLWQQRPGKNVLVCVIASDRGFCGLFNQNILRYAEKEMVRMEKEEGAGVIVFPVGKKAVLFFKRRGYQSNFNLTGIGDFGELKEIKPMADFISRSFLENRFQKVFLFYTDFISTFLQKPKKIQLLPLDKESLAKFFEEQGSTARNEFLIEPSLEILAQEILPQLIQYLIYQSVLESNASEHSARMVAMKNASENAKKRAEEFLLDYNKARQGQITREVSEISSAKEVLEVI